MDVESFLEKGKELGAEDLSIAEGQKHIRSQFPDDFSLFCPEMLGRIYFKTQFQGLCLYRSRKKCLSSLTGSIRRCKHSPYQISGS